MPAMARRTAAVAAGRSADRIASEGGAETVYAAEETVSADVRPRLQRRLRLSAPVACDAVTSVRLKHMSVFSSAVVIECAPSVMRRLPRR